MGHASIRCCASNRINTVFIISRGAEGPGREILQRPRLSIRLSVTFSFRTVTQKRIDVFSRNFAGTCTKSWCCIVFDIDGMLFEFFYEFFKY